MIQRSINRATMQQHAIVILFARRWRAAAVAVLPYEIWGHDGSLGAVRGSEDGSLPVGSREKTPVAGSRGQSPQKLKNI